MSNRILRFTVAVALVCLSVDAAAQEAPLASSAVAREAKAGSESKEPWSIEFHVGALGTVETTRYGSGSLPPDGPLIELPLSIPQVTQQVPSWYFGGGAALISRLNARNELSPVSVSSIDSLLTNSSISESSRGLVGLRLTRTLSDHLGLEMSVDLQRGPGVNAEARETLKRAATSNGRFWDDVFGVVAATERRVESGFQLGGMSVETAFSMGLRRNVWVKNATALYIVGGGGVTVRSTQGPAIRLDGKYSFTTTNLRSGNGNKYEGTDSVVISSVSNPVSGVGFVGGGWQQALSMHTGIRVDARVQVSHLSTKLALSATPHSNVVVDPELQKSGILTVGSGPLTLPAVSVIPVIVFDNNAGLSMTVPSSLSGVPISALSTGAWTEVTVRAATSVAIYVRF